MNEFRKGLALCTNHQEGMESPRSPNKASKPKPATGDRTTKNNDWQQTLEHLLSEELSQLDYTKAENGILTHGPSHQGARTSLIIHIEPTGPA